MRFKTDSEFRTKTPKSGGPEKNGLRRAIFGRLRAEPVNRSVPKTPGNLPLNAASGQAESTARMETGGGGATGSERSQGLNVGSDIVSAIRPGYRCHDCVTAQVHDLVIVTRNMAGVGRLRVRTLNSFHKTQVWRRFTYAGELRRSAAATPADVRTLHRTADVRCFSRTQARTHTQRVRSLSRLANTAIGQGRRGGRRDVPIEAATHGALGVRARPSRTLPASRHGQPPLRARAHRQPRWRQQRATR